MGNKKSLLMTGLTLLILSISFCGCIIEENGGSNTTPDETGNFSIACWNLKIFGPAKASNDTLLEYYAEKLDDYDIFIVQEIRDASGTAIAILAEEFPEGYIPNSLRPLNIYVY